MRQSVGLLRLLGDYGHLFVSPDRFLVGEAVGGKGVAEGLSGDQDRRPLPTAGRGTALRAGR